MAASRSTLESIITELEILLFEALLIIRLLEPGELELMLPIPLLLPLLSAKDPPLPFRSLSFIWLRNIRALMSSSKESTLKNLVSCMSCSI